MSQQVAGGGPRSRVHEREARATGWRYRAALMLIAGLMAFGAHAAVAAAHTQIVSTDPSQQAFFQSWIDRALVPTPDTQVAVTGTICPGGRYMACTLFSSTPATEPVIAFPDVRYLFAAPYTQDTVDQTRSRLEFLHELGRVFDWSNTAKGRLPLRASFLHVMHITGSGTAESRWAAGRIGNLAVSPRDLFGMAYGYCAAYATLPTAVLHSVYWGYGFEPSARQYTRLCALITRVGSSSSPVAVAAGH